VGVVRESRKFSGHPCIGRIARSSLRGHHSFHMKFLTDFKYRNLHGFARFPGDSTALVYVPAPQIVAEDAAFHAACRSCVHHPKHLEKYLMDSLMHLGTGMNTSDFGVKRSNVKGTMK